MFTDAVLPLLERAGLEIVAVARSGEEGLDAARRLRPQAAMVDLGLPDMSGIALGRLIRQELPDTRVVALTGRRDPEALRDAMSAGFDGYLTKDSAIGRFAESVQAALRGEAAFPQPVAEARVTHRTPEERNADLLASQLTRREREVLMLLVEGMDNTQIATRLSVSANTVRTHVQSILGKLGVRSRLQAAAFAVRHGIAAAGRHDRYA